MGQHMFDDTYSTYQPYLTSRPNWHCLDCGLRERTWTRLWLLASSVGYKFVIFISSNLFIANSILTLWELGLECGRLPRFEGYKFLHWRWLQSFHCQEPRVSGCPFARRDSPPSLVRFKLLNVLSPYHVICYYSLFSPLSSLSLSLFVVYRPKTTASLAFCS